ncbi:M1 family metallopeptidase [Cellulomonas aerilata]|uniref:Uncharacterized protein n=1 Tax=Cellulomonas aerilata TaxID=515326 RepID=A0A512DAN7_9CELL|nr:M1 family metallopeptidase [Cellulomonas aerilata]GEO33515.1 hypothetical protein CAE01nite_12400 [Cellulomonas aerilata]
MSVSRTVTVLIAMLALLAPLGGAAAAHTRAPREFTAGAAGVGDPYFPLDGNGGYDVDHYDLDLRYDPASDVLSGRATITAQATQDLSAFNLDLVGLAVRSVEVDGRVATWVRDAGELTVTPSRGLRERSRFHVVVVYDGVPQTLDTPFGPMGFVHTDDGALVLGQPHAAATWFPANDHPADAASLTVTVDVPEGLTAVSNGVLRSQDTADGWTTWTWHAREPMASYLTVLAIGRFTIDEYRADGVRFWDAIDPSLFKAEPRTGGRAAIAGTGDLAFKRLARTLTVPTGGATVSFWVDRDTEALFDYFLVEARPVGTDEWTTLRDANGHTTQGMGFSCPFWLAQHPFLTHYQSTPVAPDEPCAPTGSTGEWWAATGRSDGYEQWSVDLADYAGGAVEIALTYVTDDVVTRPGPVVDDVVVSTGEGSTSFEDDGDPLDGWTVTGPPEGSPPSTSDWVVGTAADVPPATGEAAREAFARQPEIIDFLEDLFGRYPFRAAGGIVDDVPQIGFALETQTRPVYGDSVFSDPVFAEVVIVHELAHQWTGDDLRLGRWRDIWLNEGFATYAEWLWLEREGRQKADESFGFVAGLPADDPFWSVTIGDPGPDELFSGAVYQRGAMTLHALRREIGDEAFFELLRRWPRSQRGDTVSTAELVDLATRVSGRDLDAFFRTWLFTPAKPAGLPEPPEPASTPAGDLMAARSPDAARRPAGTVAGGTDHAVLPRR